MKTRMIRFAAASVTALGFLAPGIASAHGGSTIDTTGYDSRNQIHNEIRNDIRFDTRNRINLNNYNRQTAESGYADVRDNHHVGNVSTGDAANYNVTKAEVNVETNNSAPSLGGDNSIRYTGAHSINEIKNDVRNDVRYTTSNRINIQNTNDQAAVSGDATVHNNTHVGNVSTGNAVNDNYTEFKVNVETNNN